MAAAPAPAEEHGHLPGPSVRLVARLDVKNNTIVKGLRYEGLRKLGKPGDMARAYYDQGADEVVYIDVVASLYDRPKRRGA